jgi:hypothetical protein
LTLVILDASTKEPLSARVELLDRAGNGHVAHDALSILQLEAAPSSRTPVDSTFEVTRKFRNPQTKTDQFYSTGRSTLSLPAGRYHLRIWKGLEYRVIKKWLQIDAGEQIRHEFAMTRWIDMPSRGWYSADDHIHLPRATPESNAGIHQWMAAEDIHVANLLQMGSSRKFSFAPQYAHGPKGHYRKGHHLLLSGQENPRTHFLGHMIVLGTDSPIHYPKEYLNLRKLFEEGRRQGALNGVAHFGRYGGAQFGLSFVLPHDILDFLEILQFERGSYDIWYKILNTGFRLTPTAGTDFPWGHSYPGRERFYTRVRGEFTVEKWIKAVRVGRTFVTNGPMLFFSVNRKAMGETLQLSQPGTVNVEARVVFDPRREVVNELEVIEDGVVVRTFPLGKLLSKRIVGRFQHDVRKSGWLAVRASGRKLGELPVRQSLAHSAPIYISVENTPPIARQEQARRMARSWIALLDDLEDALSDENIGELAERMASASVDVKTIRQNRPGLLNSIQAARAHFREQSR